jgi:hypothetical protein
MNYKKRVTNNLRVLFSKKGYNITFNKKHPEYKTGISFNENQKGYINTFVLMAEYFTLAAFVVLSITLGYYLGFKTLLYTPILCIIPLGLILVVNTSKFYEIGKKYGDDKGTSSLLELNLSFVPSIILIGIVLGLTENNLFFGFGFIIATSYPWLLMLCRINVFSDKSIPRYEGPKMSIELGPGYVPIVYWLLSVQVGLNVTKCGITDIGPYLASGHPTLAFCLTAIILGIISQTIVVSPDIINRVVPVDMRMKKGYILMVILTVLLVFTSYIIAYPLK